MLVRRKRKGRKRAAGSRAPILTEAHPNARRSVNFVHDQLSGGRRLRILNVIDDVTKECLAAIADTSISRRRVARELDVVIAWRGRPDLIVSDHGIAFTSNAMLAWAQGHRIAWHFIAQGKPMQNGICEAFNGRMPDELLRETIFYDLGHAREALGVSASLQSGTRPHSALGYLTLAAFAANLHRNGRSASQPRPAAPIARCSAGAPAPISAPNSGSEWITSGVTAPLWPPRASRWIGVFCARVIFGRRSPIRRRANSCRLKQEGLYEETVIPFSSRSPSTKYIFIFPLFLAISHPGSAGKLLLSPVHK